MVRVGILILFLTVALPVLHANAQTADRAQRLDRLDRVQDRITARDRIVDRVAADRVRERTAIDTAVREVDSDPIRDVEEDTVTDAPAIRNDDTYEAPVIILDPFGDRIRRGEILALNPSAAARSELARRDLRVIRERLLADGTVMYLFRSATATNVTDLLSRLQAMDPAGLYAPNHVFAPNGTPAPPQDHAPTKPLTPSGAPCNIGLIDGPVTALQPAFQSSIAHTQRFEHGPSSQAIHGAAVAYRLIDTVKQIDASRTLSICAADVFVAGPEEAITAEAIAAAIDWQMAQQVDLVNASLAGPHNVVVAWSVERFLASDGVLIAAVGNGGPLSRNIYPAAYEGVIGVTAIDNAGSLYPLATRGSHVDVAARGVRVDVSQIGVAAPLSGTSFAAPLVSGWLFARSVPHAPPLQTLKQNVIDRGEPGRDYEFGFGELPITAAAKLHFAAGTDNADP